MKRPPLPAARGGAGWAATWGGGGAAGGEAGGGRTRRPGRLARRRGSGGLGAPRGPPRHQVARGLALCDVRDHGLGDRLPVVVAWNDLEHGDRGQVSVLLEAFAVAAQQSLRRHLGEEALEGNVMATLDGEGAGDLG